jgi:two-component sensor histidine kinase/putative methionine-R-sulfoxide reductase with GAF domain
MEPSAEATALHQTVARYQLLSAIAGALLSAEQPQDMIRSFYAKLSAHLGLEVYFNYLVTADGTRLRLDSCAGVPADVAQRLALLDFGEAICGTVAQQCTRLVAEDIQHSLDPRAALVRSLGIQAYACQPLLADGHLLGTLSFGTRRRPRFTPDELALLQTIANQVAIAIARRRAEAALRQANLELERRVQARTAELTQANAALQAMLREKEVLLKEIHHRVKNNLQIIASLLSLQASASADPQLAVVVHGSRQRIHAMALVHEQLYRAPDLSHIAFAPYVHSLARYLLASSALTPHVHLATTLAPVDLAIAAAVPCALIVTELLTNALKHAFPQGRPGEIHLALQVEPPTQVRFSVRNTGVGLPDGLDLQHPKSFGLRLVRLLTAQLGGTLELDRTAGTHWTLRFPQVSP